jgi:hypothetical protein
VLSAGWAPALPTGAHRLTLHAYEAEGTSDAVLTEARLLVISAFCRRSYVPSNPHASPRLDRSPHSCSDQAGFPRDHSRPL